MNQYIFILGNNPELSVTEIKSVYPQISVIKKTDIFLIGSLADFDCQKAIHILGGTIKIGEILGSQISRKVTVEKLKQIQKESKLNFGLSYYDCSKDNLGMEIKKELKAAGVSCRLVVSRDKILSSVVVSKNQCAEFLILGKKWLGMTLAVQDFADYSQRDYGRPARDLLSGSMPPKLAKIMINLAQVSKGGKILDPFCGSGTVLQEGILLGYEMAGSDISQKAIKDSKENLEWLFASFPRKRESSVKKVTDPRLRGDDSERVKAFVFQVDVRKISQKINSIDAIVTEPYLGPPLKGLENRKQISEIINDLSKLYLDAFGEFRKILNYNSKVVIVFPAFRSGKEILELPILQQIKKLGFTQLNKDKLIYSRPDQKLWRQIYIFQLSR